jgi:hypothetical protein
LLVHAEAEEVKVSGGTMPKPADLIDDLIAKTHYRRGLPGSEESSTKPTLRSLSS